MPAARPTPASRPPRREGVSCRANRRRGRPSVDAAPAQPERPAARAGAADRPRRRLARRIAGLTLRLCLTGGLVYGLLFGVQAVYRHATTSSRFEVRHLRYEPTRHVTDDVVRDLLALEPGTNILALDLHELGRRVTAHPWVAEATVVRELPDTLEVHVREHHAAAVVLAGKLYLADEAGVLFKEAARGEAHDLPVVTGVDRRAIATDRAAAEARVREALGVLERWHAKRRPRLSEIHLGDTGEVVLYTAETGTMLKLGRGELDAKIARFDALRAAIGEKEAELAVVHLDARSTPNRPDRVVARFFDPATEALLLAESAAASGPSQADPSAPVDPQTGPNPEHRAPKKRRIPRAY
jgi:cell division protein FtsQ